MRRWLSILLLVLLPLQATWAAVAVYCQHETGTAAQHFGHHEHKHQHQGGSDNSSDTKPFGAADNDCSACHAGCVVAISASTQASHSMPALIAVDAYRHGLTSPPAYLPERPNWMPLA